MNKQKIGDFEDLDKIKLAEFLGWHLGDGCLSISNNRYQYFLTGDLIEEYPFYKKIIIPTFNKIFNGYFNKKIELKKYKSNGVCGIYVYNKLFVKYLKEKIKIKPGKKIDIEIPNIIATKDEKIAFLRGLFDTDGSIYYCKSNYKTKNKSLFTGFHYKSKIQLATISKSLIDQVYSLLCELGFSPMLRKPNRQKANENMMYGVILHRNVDIKRFIQEIGFKNLKHITKIQIWQKFGFCPPFTKLKQRKNILKGNINPLVFYPQYSQLSLDYIKETLTKK